MPLITFSAVLTFVTSRSTVSAHLRISLDEVAVTKASMYLCRAMSTRHRGRGRIRDVRPRYVPGGFRMALVPRRVAVRAASLCASGWSGDPPPQALATLEEDWQAPRRRRSFHTQAPKVHLERNQSRRQSPQAAQLLPRREVHSPGERRGTRINKDPSAFARVTSNEVAYLSMGILSAIRMATTFATGPACSRAMNRELAYSCPGFLIKPAKTLTLSGESPSKPGSC